jgi:hypothetical protein
LQEGRRNATVRAGSVFILGLREATLVIAILVIATVADLGLAALLITVSGFFFGAGPESMHGGSLAAGAYTAMVIACILAPVAGFIFKHYGKFGLGLLVA